MKLIWTKSEAPLSQLIRWGLDEPVSHFAVLFEEGFVMQANLFGVIFVGEKLFREKSEIVLEIPVEATIDQEEEVYKAFLVKDAGKPYDLKGLAFFMWRAALKKFFKIPLPARNEWGEKGAFICTEIAEALPAWVVPIDALPEDTGIISPYQLFHMISKSRSTGGEPTTNS